MHYLRRRIFIKNMISRQLRLAIVAASFTDPLKNILKRFSIFTLILVMIFPFPRARYRNEKSDPFSIRQIRAIEANEIGLTNPSGLAFSSKDDSFHIVDTLQTSSTDIDFVKVDQLSEWAGSVRIATGLQNPMNMTFDNQSNRLLFLNGLADQLLEVRADDDGNLNSAAIVRYNTKDLGLKNPQGMTVDKGSGSLFILDAEVPRIVHVQLLSDGSFNWAGISQIDLQSQGFSDVHGIAINPASGHFFVINPMEQTLYELTPSGELLATWDLAPFNLKNPQAIVFAPSGDQTDDPAQLNLYVADSGLVEEQNSMLSGASQTTGKIVELSLSALIEPAAANFTSSLIRTTNMAAISPPSPDPSGIAYVPSKNTLLIVDGEVEETVSGITHFQGANIWELTLSGSKVRTANISKISPTMTPMTNEPTGVASNPGNGHYYVSDDDDKRVYDLNPGADGLVGTSDDTWTYFSTQAVGSGDPEGISFNTWNNHIFVADGVNQEIYEFTITGSLINHFDVQKYGVADPESVEFNSKTGTLFTMSSNKASPIIVETKIDGTLLQTINISITNAQAAAGLGYAPASNGSGRMRFYIVDRGIDNDTNPNLVDGKMYEITAPTDTATFSDVPTTYWAWGYIERLYSDGITSGCSTSPMKYCPTTMVTRDQMAVFLLKAKHTSSYVPPPATGVFQDVPTNYWAAAWIEELAAEGITSGCSVNPQQYCPITPVTRDQLAVFLLKAKYGSGYAPPAATGVFQDVPTNYWAAAWIEQLAAEGITSGCSVTPKLYCPTTSVTRDQMAVFLVKNFNLP